MIAAANDTPLAPTADDRAIDALLLEFIIVRGGQRWRARLNRWRSDVRHLFRPTNQN